MERRSLLNDIVERFKNNNNVITINARKDFGRNIFKMIMSFFSKTDYRNCIGAKITEKQNVDWVLL